MAGVIFQQTLGLNDYPYGRNQTDSYKCYPYLDSESRFNGTANRNVEFDRDFSKSWTCVSTAAFSNADSTYQVGANYLKPTRAPSVMQSFAYKAYLTLGEVAPISENLHFG